MARLTFAAALAVIAVLSLESVEPVRCDSRYYAKHYSTSSQLGDRPRSTRGFKGALSTARGFGKRNLPAVAAAAATTADADSFPQIEAYERQNSPTQRMAVISLLLRHLLQNDAEAVRMILKKSTESNRGEEISPYELIRHADAAFAENVNSYDER